MLQVRNPLNLMVHLQKTVRALFAECVLKLVLVLGITEGVLKWRGEFLNIFAFFKMFSWPTPS